MQLDDLSEGSLVVHMSLDDEMNLVTYYAHNFTGVDTDVAEELSLMVEGFLVMLHADPEKLMTAAQMARYGVVMENHAKQLEALRKMEEADAEGIIHFAKKDRMN